MAGPAEQPFFCQSCRTRLSITDIDALDQPGPSGRHSALLTGSIFGGTRTDESFILLDSSKRGTAATSLDTSIPVLPGTKLAHDAHARPHSGDAQSEAAHLDVAIMAADGH